MKNCISYAVIGAGNGGLAMAGYLAKEGFIVNLYNRTLQKILPLMERPTITLTGEKEGTGKLNIVSDNIKKVIENVDIIMVTIPAIGHYSLGKLMAPYLKDGQVIILNPGRTGGALELYTTLRKNGCNKDIVVGEAQTFIYACRKTSARSAHIYREKNEVSLACIPAMKTDEVIQMLSDVYPQFVPARDVIETSMNNYGAIFHPAPTLLNSGHIERGATFDYYTEGITPSISRFLEKMDNERMRIAQALNVNTCSAKDWLYESYGAVGTTLYEAIQNNPGYKGLLAPKGLNTRYIYEDVPYSLVPMSSLGKQLNIDTPAIDSVIRLAGLMTGKDFWNEGRTVEHLGLNGLDLDEIHNFAQTGIVTKEKGVVA